jgi:glycosyltransferase involved in cell wall biosynthesis
LHIVVTVNAAWNLVNFRTGLLRALIADGHRVTVLAPHDDSVARLQALGCAFVDLPMNRKGLSPLANLHIWRRLGAAMDRLRPDVVLSFTIKNNLYGALAARRRRIPFIPNVTGLGTAFLSGGGLQRVAQMIYRHAFRGLPVVFFQNRDDLELFAGMGLVRPGQARVLPGSGIDLTRFAPAPMPENPPDAPVFLMIARLLRDKGVVEFADAAAVVRRQFPHAQFRIVGPFGTENRSALPPAQIMRWQDAGHIVHLGAMPDVRPAIAEADCVVLPSYREGMPRVLLEAAAMARPVITTDVPGCRDALDAGKTGLLCQPRDSASLARACADFITLTPEARAAMGQAGRARRPRRAPVRRGTCDRGVSSGTGRCDGSGGLSLAACRAQSSSGGKSSARIAEKLWFR